MCQSFYSSSKATKPTICYFTKEKILLCITWNNRQNPAKMKQYADQDNEAILSKEKYFTL